MVLVLVTERIHGEMAFGCGNSSATLAMPRIVVHARRHGRLQTVPQRERF